MHKHPMCADTDRELSAVPDQGMVSASFVWGSGTYPVRGRFRGVYVLENGSLQVRLHQLETGPADFPAPSLWVPGERIAEPDPLLLRSEIWELPAGADRDLVLRTVTHALSEQMKEQGRSVALGRQWPGTVELVVAADVPLESGVEYLAALLPLRHRCNPRPAPWKAPADIVAGRELESRDRPGAAYQLGHLPGWVESRHFWSVLSWSPSLRRLTHTVQFSLPERFQRTVMQRFRLQAGKGAVPGEGPRS